MRIELVFMGIALIMIGMALMTISSNFEYGGVIIIGPFPIVFGSSLNMVLFGIILAVILILLTLILVRW